MNAFSYRFRPELRFDENKQLRYVLDGNYINLVPIMTHELGHAFGLAHNDDSEVTSIMDAQLSLENLVPTKLDVIALVEVLDKSIQGATPGVLQFVSSEGISATREREARERLSGLHGLLPVSRTSG